MGDHVHALARLSRTLSTSEWIKEVKRVSSGMAKPFLPGFAWQGGYAVFSVDKTSLDRIASYVRNQEEHHQKFSFQDELRKLMVEHGIEWDERYVWD
ncbi:MAG: transposase [Fimbriimonadales bacterium]